MGGGGGNARKGRKYRDCVLEIHRGCVIHVMSCSFGSPAGAPGGICAALNFLPRARTFMIITCAKSLWPW